MAVLCAGPGLGGCRSVHQRQLQNLHICSGARVYRVQLHTCKRVSTAQLSLHDNFGCQSNDHKIFQALDYQTKSLDACGAGKNYRTTAPLKSSTASPFSFQYIKQYLLFCSAQFTQNAANGFEVVVPAQLHALRL